MVGCFRVEEIVWNYVTTFWHSRLSTLNSEWESPADPFIEQCSDAGSFFENELVVFRTQWSHASCRWWWFWPMHACTHHQSHTCFSFFPKVGLKFEADHWQVDTSGSHYFIHSHRPMKSRKKSIVIESNCWRPSNIQKHFFQSRDTAKFDFTQAHTTHTTRTTLTSQDICVCDTSA
jgi:hypothetical protein